jgi:peptidoglycan hydrolase CwlO-like protein
MIDKQPPKTYISNPTEPNHHRDTEFTRNLGLSSLAINQINSQSESIFKSIDNLTNKINSLEPTILEIKSCIDWFKHRNAKWIFGVVLSILMFVSTFVCCFGAWFWDASVIKPITRLEKSNKNINETLNSIDNQLSFLKGSFEVVNENKAQAPETH